MTNLTCEYGTIHESHARYWVTREQWQPIWREVYRAMALSLFLTRISWILNWGSLHKKKNGNNLVFYQSGSTTSAGLVNCKIRVSGLVTPFFFMHSSRVGPVAYLKVSVKFQAHSGDIYYIYTSDNNDTLELRFIIHSGYIQNTFRKFQKQFYTFIWPSGNFQIKFMWFPEVEIIVVS